MLDKEERLKTQSEDTHVPMRLYGVFTHLQFIWDT